MAWIINFALTLYICISVGIWGFGAGMSTEAGCPEKAPSFISILGMWPITYIIYKTSETDEITPTCDRFQ